MASKQKTVTREETKKENPMRAIRIGKVVFSIGLGSNLQDIERAEALARLLTGKKPVRTKSTRKARSFGVGPRRDIGVKVTLRGEDAKKFLEKVLPAIEKKIPRKSFDDYGNFGFGIEEYLEIPGMKYDPSIGVMGFNVAVSLERPGYRIARRKRKRTKVPRRHRITKEEAIEFVQKELGVRVV